MDQWHSECDGRIIFGLRAGSEATFAEMYRLYAPRLYRTILAIVKSPEDAEDALQETLMRAVVAFDSFEGRSKLISWLTADYGPWISSSGRLNLKDKLSGQEAMLSPV